MNESCSTDQVLQHTPTTWKYISQYPFVNKFTF